MVRDEIEKELEKENLDRERGMAGDASSPEHAEGDSTVGDIKSSAVLMGDLEEVRSKIEKFQSRRELAELPTLRAKGDAVVSCYKCVPLPSLAYLRLLRAYTGMSGQIPQRHSTAGERSLSSRPQCLRSSRYIYLVHHARLPVC